MQLSKVIDQVKRAAEKEAQAQSSKQQYQGITQSELVAAWKVLSPNGCPLNRHETYNLLKLCYPGLTAPQLKELAAQGASLDSLQQLLVENPPSEVDVAAQGMKVLDPGRTGGLDLGALQHLLTEVMKLPQLDEEELRLVMQLADVDGDGRISLQDWAMLLKRQQQELQQQQQQQQGLLSSHQHL